MTWNPKDYGATTRADVGVFLVGAGIGGVVDAVINWAGFAEPFVFAGICGAGALGAKQLVFDGIRDRYRKTDVREQQMEQLEAEASLLEEKGETDNAKLLKSAIEKGKERNLTPEAIRDLYLKTQTPNKAA